MSKLVLMLVWLVAVLGFTLPSSRLHAQTQARPKGSAASDALMSDRALDEYYEKVANSPVVEAYREQVQAMLAANPSRYVDANDNPECREAKANVIVMDQMLDWRFEQALRQGYLTASEINSVKRRLMGLPQSKRGSDSMGELVKRAIALYEQRSCVQGLITEGYARRYRLDDALSAACKHSQEQRSQVDQALRADVENRLGPVAQARDTLARGVNDLLLVWNEHRRAGGASEIDATFLQEPAKCDEKSLAFWAKREREDLIARGVLQENAEERAAHVASCQAKLADHQNISRSAAWFVKRFEELLLYRETRLSPHRYDAVVGDAAVLGDLLAKHRWLTCAARLALDETEQLERNRGWVERGCKLDPNVQRELSERAVFVKRDAALVRLANSNRLLKDALAYNQGLTARRQEQLLLPPSCEFEVAEKIYERRDAQYAREDAAIAARERERSCAKRFAAVESLATSTAVLDRNVAMRAGVHRATLQHAKRLEYKDDSAMNELLENYKVLSCATSKATSQQARVETELTELASLCGWSQAESAQIKTRLVHGSAQRAIERQVATAAELEAPMTAWKERAGQSHATIVALLKGPPACDAASEATLNEELAKSKAR